MNKETRPAKNGFLLYKTQWEPIEDLDNEELGMLLRAIFEYQITGQEPPKKSPIAVYFKFFKSQFGIDENGYADVVEKRRVAGIESALRRKEKKEAEQNQQVSTKPTHVESVEQIQQTQQVSTPSTKPTDKENDNGKDNVNDNGKDSLSKREKKEPEFPEPDTPKESGSDIVTPWAYLKVRKSIALNELELKYTYIMLEDVGIGWEKWLLANKPTVFEERDIGGMWKLFDWYANNANTSAKKAAEARKKHQGQQGPHVNGTARDITKLDQPFD